MRPRSVSSITISSASVSVTEMPPSCGHKGKQKESEKCNVAAPLSTLQPLHYAADDDGGQTLWKTTHNERMSVAVWAKNISS